MSKKLHVGTGLLISRIITEKPHQGIVNKVLLCIVLYCCLKTGFANVTFLDLFMSVRDNDLYSVGRQVGTTGLLSTSR